MIIIQYDGDPIQKVIKINLKKNNIIIIERKEGRKEQQG
jgi:hypothetical protein